MRKLVLITTAALFLMVGAAPAANALGRGTVCREHNGPDGPDGIQLEVCLHTNMDMGTVELQGKGFWKDASPFALCGLGNPQIRWQRETSNTEGIELRRGPFQQVPTFVVRDKVTGWLDMCEHSHTATPWYDACQFGINYEYRSTGRYQLRFNGPAFPWQPTSVWYTHAADNFTIWADDC